MQQPYIDWQRAFELLPTDDVVPVDIPSHHADWTDGSTTSGRGPGLLQGLWAIAALAILALKHAICICLAERSCMPRAARVAIGRMSHRP